jgi:hypothetical protein
VCESCLEERLEEERRSQLVYSRAAIYVRQVDKIGALTDNLMDVPSTSAISTSIAEDPDFQVSNFLLLFSTLFSCELFQSSIVFLGGDLGDWLCSRDTLNSPNISRKEIKKRKVKELSKVAVYSEERDWRRRRFGM